jgi:hypothetical protein
MDTIPNEILCTIFEFIDKIELMRLFRISKSWKNLIEEEFFIKKEIPTIEECMITSDFYYLSKIYKSTLEKDFEKAPDRKTQIFHYRKLLKTNENYNLKSYFNDFQFDCHISPNHCRIVMTLQTFIFSESYYYFTLACITKNELLKKFLKRFIPKMKTYAIRNVQLLMKDSHLHKDQSLYNEFKLVPDINYFKEKLLIRAIINEHLDAIKYLIGGINLPFLYSTPLATSVFIGNPEIIELLLQSGADPRVNSDSVIELSYKIHNYENTKLLANYCDMNGILKFNVGRHKITTIEGLLKHLDFNIKIKEKIKMKNQDE